jgi:small-conductance mechanosensitive channel/CRP-like cAMP-binding protein
MEPWAKILLCAAGWALLTILLTVLQRRLRPRQHPLDGTVRGLRNLLLPLLLVLALWHALDGPRADDVWFRLLETVLWMAGLVVALSLVRNTAFTQKDGGQYQTRVPKLFLDILRVILVLVGAVFVVKGVWGQDVSALVTAVGVSSIVLGLALQNTLDNVMAGIAVLFERPFEVGDWVQVGSTTGQVMEMNWRSVRVRTRAQDLVVVPNSVIGKETLVNYSRPTRAHNESHLLGFSYDDPPNKVKRVLQQVALTTRGVLPNPAPVVRTVNYAAWSIEYQVRFTIEDFERQQEVNDEFMTKVWYAAKRNRLTIPFPVQTTFEYSAEMPKPKTPSVTVDSLTRVPVFVPLGPEELELLGHDAVRQDYGRGERIVHQGEPGDSLYLIEEGTAVVSVKDEHGTEREVTRLSRGEFFGEMALLTGEPRSASVTAADDLTVLVVYKEALQSMLARRPPLAEEMAEIMEARRQGLRAIQELRTAPPEQRVKVQRGASDLVQRIRHFLGL